MPATVASDARRTNKRRESEEDMMLLSFRKKAADGVVYCKYEWIDGGDALFPPNQGHNPFQPGYISCAEIVQRITIHVQHHCHLASLIEHRHDDLRF